MNILYISYWGINEGITQGTVLLNIKLLAENTSVDKIFLFTIERNGNQSRDDLGNDIIHIPVASSTSVYAKIRELLTVPFLIRKYIRSYGIQLIICRSNPASNFGYLAYLMTGIKFIVESYEPHKEYMFEAGVWGKYSFRYQIQKFFDIRVMYSALALMPVSKYYLELLKKETLASNKLYYMPCVVDSSEFIYSNSERSEVRKQLRIDESTLTGIYSGKFGDIYFDTEAFDLFKIATNELRYHIILLTPQIEYAEKMCEKYQINRNLISIKFVAHAQVSSYLSAADFALSLIKPSENRIYCSPVKNGEYWASGLPILIPENIGEDSQIVKSEKFGAILDFNNFKKGLIEIGEVSKSVSERNPTLAQKYRNPKLVRDVYAALI